MTMIFFAAHQKRQDTNNRERDMSEAPETIWTCDHLGEYGQYYPEAVEAEGDYGGTAVEYTRADLSPQPKVKPLPWDDEPDGSYANVLGLHYYTENGEDGWSACCMVNGDDIWNAGCVIKLRETAKAACQDDFTARLSALE